jgi:hypothetical protein
MSKLINTENKKDLVKFAQALLLTKFFIKVSEKEITLLECGSEGSCMITYLLFSTGCTTYKYMNKELSVVLD